jgi:hypothetical protein
VNPNDKIWAMYNQRLEDALNRNSWFEAATIYAEMARHIEQEGEDSQFLKAQEYQMKLEALNERLLAYKQGGGLEIVEVLINSDSCKSCASLTEKEFNLDVALKTAPIPIKQCTNINGCRCTYLPVIS